MGKIEISEFYCKGCELCIQVCAQKTLKRGDRITSFGTLIPVQADPERCTGCALCAVICPDAAIDVYK